jgi:Tol biopolymer transport system component
VLNEHTGDSENGPTRADLWVQGIDGSGRVNLTRGEAVNLMPSWGPDGTLFFVTDRTGRDTIWAIPAGDPAAGTGSRVASQPVPMDGE